MEDTCYLLRILHISDLHESGPHEGEPWRRRRVLGEAWDRNIAELLQDGPVDLVCFTGDAANWGLPEQFESATDFFKSLLERLHLGADRLFLVPGNHDIQRPAHENIWSEVRNNAPRIDPLEFTRWMSGRGSPLGFDDAWRDNLLARQGAYRHWIREGLGRPELDPAQSPHGLLGYRATLEMAGWSFPVHLIGLDTAWLCGDDSDSGRLRLTDGQVLSLTADSRGDLLSGLRLVLMHHPFGDLADGAECKRLLGQRADFVLRGHLHETEVETHIDPDRRVRLLAAGCLYEGWKGDRYRNACQLLTLSLDTNGRPTRIDLRFRSFSPHGGHWYDDDSLYRESRGGRLTWAIDQTIIAKKLPNSPRYNNPYNPWQEVVGPPRFLGRKPLLEALEDALEKVISVSLVGDWRIGKSSVLRTWYERQSGRGREVRLLSGEKAEGISPRTLVEAITGHQVRGEGADQAAEVLDHWAEAKGRPGLAPLILIDELDGMVPRFEHRFFERIRGMLERIVLVVSSRQELDLIYEELSRTSPFDNKLRIQWVGLLEPSDAERLISWGGEAIGTKGAGLMLRWAGRHPFYLQLLGYHLIMSRNSNQSATAALEGFRSDAASRLRELWRVLDARDRESLHGTLAGKPAVRRSLRARGLVDEQGQAFGKVLTEWLREEA